MSGLDIFEELRYIIELLLAEYMFAYFFAKKKKEFGSFMAAGEVLLCIISVFYIFVQQTVVVYGNELIIVIVTCVWYIGLLFLTMFFIKVCFEISFSDILFIAISGYAAMHIEYVVVNEVLALGVWSYLQTNLPLYIIICTVSCGLWYLFIMRIFAAKLRACDGKLYEDTKETIGLFLVLLIILLFGTFTCQSVFRGWHQANGTENNYLGALMDFFICTLVLVVQYSAFRINTLSREKEIVKQLLYERQKQYQLSKENIEIINHKCHDLKHQLEALKHADSKDMQQYLAEVEDSIMIYDHVVETENEVLNTILSEKSLYCEKHQITLTCIADAAPLDFMSVMDIYALLGNALDNAIEAVSKYEEVEKRVVSLTISSKNDFLCIQTNNYVDEELQFKDGLPLSTKKRNRAYHGFGMKSMKHLTEKYGGTLVVSQEKNIFMLQIILPMPKEFVRLLKEKKKYDL